MRTVKSILVVAVILGGLISTSSGSSWVKGTTYSHGQEEAQGIRDKNAAVGIFSRRWAGDDNAGVSCAAWSRATKDQHGSSNKPRINAYDLYIKQRYDWPGRNPPLALFTCNWTEAFYMENAGDCDNHSLFNGKGAADAYADIQCCISDGPDNGLQSRYGVNLRAAASNNEKQISENPNGRMNFGCMPGIRTDLSWDDEPDHGKAWRAAAGDIISFSAGMDNGHNASLTDNLWVRAYSGVRLEVQTQEKAARAYAGVFHQIADFNLKIDKVLAEPAGNNELYEPYQPAKEPDARAALAELRKTWRSTADSSGLPREQIALVINLLDEVLEPSACRKLDRNRLTGSISRYLEQFKHTFSGDYAEQACYWTAWLLAETAKRPAPTAQDIESARVSFEALINDLINVLEAKAREAIGDANYSKCQPAVNMSLTRAKDRLRDYLEQLHNDPLFPIFKKPLDYGTRQQVLGHLSNETILDSLLNRQMKTVPEEEFYKKWLEFYFDRVPARVVFRLVVVMTKPDIRKPEYWGGMHQRAKSCADSTWPIEMHLIKID